MLKAVSFLCITLPSHICAEKHVCFVVRNMVNLRRFHLLVGSGVFESIEDQARPNVSMMLRPKKNPWSNMGENSEMSLDTEGKWYWKRVLHLGNSQGLFDGEKSQRVWRKCNTQLECCLQTNILYLNASLYVLYTLRYWSWWIFVLWAILCLQNLH